MAIATIDEGMLQRTWQEIEYRLDVPRATNGVLRGVLNGAKRKKKDSHFVIISTCLSFQSPLS